MIRILGEDLKPESIQSVQIAPTGQPVTEQQDEAGNVIGAIYDLTKGKYDLTVAAGPSFTTRREEAAMQMESLIQKVPEAGALIGDLYASALDWPMADEIAARLKRMVPPQALGEQPAQIPPQVQQQMEQMQGMIQQGGQHIQEQAAKIAELEAEARNKVSEQAVKAAEMRLKQEELQVKRYEAETDRMRASLEAQRPSEPPRWPQGTA